MERLHERILIGIMVNDYGKEFVKLFLYFDEEQLDKLINENKNIQHFINSLTYTNEDVKKHIQRIVDIYGVCCLELNEEEYIFDDKFINIVENPDNLDNIVSYDSLKDTFILDMWEEFIDSKNEDERHLIEYFVDFNVFNQKVKEKIADDEINWFNSNINKFKKYGVEILSSAEDKYYLAQTDSHEKTIKNINLWISEEFNILKKKFENNKGGLEDIKDLEKAMEEFYEYIEKKYSEKEQERKTYEMNFNGETQEEVIEKIEEYINNYKQYEKFKLLVSIEGFTEDIQKLIFTGLKNKEDISKIDRIIRDHDPAILIPVLVIKLKDGNERRFTFDKIEDDIALYGKFEWSI